MADAITIQELIDARTDAKTLEEAVNGDAVTTVLSRLGESYPTLANALSQIDGKLDSADTQIKQAITDLFENGGLPATPFATKALMTASALIDGDYAMVTDDTVNNGLYVKTAGAWVKSSYDPTALANAYTDNKVKGVTNNFKTKALVVASALPDGSYAMVTEDTEANNGWYSKVAGAWVKSNYDPLTQSKSYTDSKIVKYDNNVAKNNSISDIKIVKNISGNLLDVSKFVINKSISQTTGLETTSTSAVSPFIGVESAQAYTLNLNNKAVPRYLFFYDQYKGLISYILAGLTANGVAKTFTTPANTAYLRLETTTGTLDIYDVMLNKGETALDYTPYSSVLDGVGLPDSQINSILNKVDTRALEYINVSDNLIKSDNLVHDKVVSSSGVIVDNATLKMTPLLQLGDNTTITLLMEIDGAIRYIAYYDAAGSFISRSSETYVANTVTTTTPPSNATAFRLILGGAAFESGFKVTAVLGTVPTLQHIDYDGVLKNIKLSYDNLATVMQMVNDNFVINNDPNPRFYLDGASDAILRVDNTNWIDYTDWKIESVRTRSAADVYAMYDQLVTDHPNYITKEVLGQEITGKEIAVYTIKPRDYVAAHTFRPPKVFITCGTHGHEPVSPLAIHQLINAMLTQWQSNTELAFLLFNIELIVIPVTNPWGWDNNERRNSNLVDINRNFPYFFASGEVGSATYGGAAPLSELESQYIKQVFDANTDIDVFFDFHNFVGSPQGGAYFWNVSVYDNGADGVDIELTHRVSTLLFSRMQRTWAGDYDWFPKDYEYKVGYATEMQGGVIAGYAGKNLGIPISSTFELSARWEVNPNAVAYDKTHTKTMVEAVGNYLMLCIDNLKYRK